MKKTLPLVLILLAALILAFLAGAWVTHWSAAKRAAAGGRKILHYVDPMHPSYTSDKPGIAPDCGMQLEPVYEDGVIGEGGGTMSAPGTVRVSHEKRQAIGVAVGKVESAPWSGSVRILGKVEPDEARTFRITAATDIWVRKTFPPTTGSLIKKDEPMAAYFTNGFLAASNAYMYALDTQRRHTETTDVSQAQAQNLDFQMRQAVANLINMGVAESQIRDMKESGKISDLVEIRSPSDGFVIARAVSEGQFISVGSELYRIADIRKVWILADLFEYESRFARAGQVVKVHYLDKIYQAKITDILPQFDPISRTFKVRLEMDNPKYIFRPDMFVDVELPVNMPKSVTVPSGAVVDTGMRKTVFVEVADGVFEPRHVETGWRFGDRIEITKGLREGERIVLSGNFLVDSESRIQLAAVGLPEDYVIDPVCGMGVNPRKARFQGDYKGQNYYFCSADCKAKFAADPGKYLQARLNVVNDKPEIEPHHSASNMQKSKEHDSREKTKDSGTAVDPVCGMEVNIGKPGALKAEYQGKTYYFCNPMCRESFQKNPAKYASR